MAAKPETTFIKAIHRLIPNVFAENNNNPFRSGQADIWYSGCSGDLWVEYKYTKILRESTEFRPNTSPLQNRWLGCRLDEGRNVAVVVGTPTGAIIYLDREWLVPAPFGEHRKREIPRKELATWIFNQVGEQCVSLE